MLPSLTRLQQLHQALSHGEALSLKEIANRFQVTERHARRLLDLLRAQGIPVQDRREGRRKRFYLPVEHLIATVKRVSFDEQEMLALAVAAEAARAALGPTPLGLPLNRAFDKLLAQLAPEALTFEVEAQPLRWHFDTAQPVDPVIFKTLQQAINAGQSVRIDYLTASTGNTSVGRLIDPLQIAMPRGSWLLVAYCHTRHALRDFALAGIEHVEVCEAYFSPPPNFDPDNYFRDRFSALAGDEVFTIRLLVEPDRAPYFERKEYHRTQLIEEKRADGRLVVSYEVAGLDEIRSFVQGWGVGVTVLAPPELVQRITDEITVLMDRYA